MLILFGFEYRRALAQPRDVDAVGDLEHMRHVVADQDHRQALVAHAADQLQHHVAFLDAERGGGFVEDDHVRGEGRGARHRHALALAAGQRFHRLRHRADADLQVVHALDAGLQHLLLVEHAQHVAEEALAPQLAAEEQVLGDGHRRRDRQVLVAAFDAGAARVDRRAELHRLAVEQDLAGVGHGGAGQRLDQAALAGAVVADHRQDLAGAQLEVGAVQRRDLAVALDQAAGLHHEGLSCHGGCSFAFSGPTCATAGPPPPPRSPGCR